MLNIFFFLKTPFPTPAEAGQAFPRGEGAEYQSIPFLEIGKWSCILLFTRCKVTPYISCLTKRAVYNILIL